MFYEKMKFKIILNITEIYLTDGILLDTTAPD